MEVMEFIRTFKRYCDKQCKAPGGCYECVLGKNLVCRGNMDIDAMRVDEELVNSFEDWAKKNPAKTRQSEFLKIFPNVKLDEDGIIDICPDKVDSSIECDDGCKMYCGECRYDFWLDEVE